MKILTRFVLAVLVLFSIVPSICAQFDNAEQWDFAANKTFIIRESLRLQFRSEFFNFLNHTNFGIPNTRTTDAAFGTIRTTYPGRQIQFALKLMF